MDGGPWADAPSFLSGISNSTTKPRQREQLSHVPAVLFGPPPAGQHGPGCTLRAPHPRGCRASPGCRLMAAPAQTGLTIGSGPKGCWCWAWPTLSQQTSAPLRPGRVAQASPEEWPVFLPGGAPRSSTPCPPGVLGRHGGRWPHLPGPPPFSPLPPPPLGWWPAVVPLRAGQDPVVLSVGGTQGKDGFLCWQPHPRDLPT